MGEMMKPFNIEGAKAGKKVVTRGGYPVRIVAWDISGKRPIASAQGIYHKDSKVQVDEECVVSHYVDGSCDCTRNHERDLMMGTKTVKGWINIYKSPTGKGSPFSQTVHDCEEIARLYGSQCGGVIAVSIAVPIEYEVDDDD